MPYSDKHEILHQLHHCVALLRRKHRDGGASGSGTNHGQRRALCVLEENDGVSQKELYMRMGGRPASISELIKRMEEGGLVARHQSGKDKRVTHVFLTDAGHKAARRTLAARNNIHETFFAHLDEAELHALTGLLGKLIAGLQDGVEGETDPYSYGHPHHHKSGKHPHHRASRSPEGSEMRPLPE